LVSRPLSLSFLSSLATWNNYSFRTRTPAKKKKKAQRSFHRSSSKLNQMKGTKEEK
jgi:hypothetical protein